MISGKCAGLSGIGTRIGRMIKSDEDRANDRDNELRNPGEPDIEHSRGEPVTLYIATGRLLVHNKERRQKPCSHIPGELP